MLRHAYSSYTATNLCQQVVNWYKPMDNWRFRIEIYCLLKSQGLCIAMYYPLGRQWSNAFNWARFSRAWIHATSLSIYRWTNSIFPLIEWIQMVAFNLQENACRRRWRCRHRCRQVTQQFSSYPFVPFSVFPSLYSVQLFSLASSIAVDFPFRLFAPYDFSHFTQCTALFRSTQHAAY